MYQMKTKTQRSQQKIHSLVKRTSRGVGRASVHESEYLTSSRQIGKRNEAGVNLSQKAWRKRFMSGSLALMSLKECRIIKATPKSQNQTRPNFLR